MRFNNIKASFSGLPFLKVRADSLRLANIEF
jgi:hypothetical protein